MNRRGRKLRGGSLMCRAWLRHRRPQRTIIRAL